MATPPRQTRGGGKGSSRDEDRLSDPLLDRDLARRTGGLTEHAKRWRLIPGSPWLRLVFGLAIAVLLALVVTGAAHAEAGLAAVPPHAARVTDQAGILTAQQRSALDGVLADYERKTGSQIAILLLPSTAPEAIEQYSIRVADAWKLGRKGIDDGVLLVVAKDNPPSLRRLRIESGRGVQGSLTDAQSKRILQDVIAPRFREGDFYGGLGAGVNAIAALLDKERGSATSSAVTDSAPAAGAGGWSGGWLLPLLLFGAFVVLPIMRGGGRRGLRSGGWGSDATGVLIGAALGNALGAAANRGSGGWGGGGFGGGGGTFDGGGASGDW